MLSFISPFAFRKRRSGGFTLIELKIVISVIAILLTLAGSFQINVNEAAIYPTLGQVRTQLTPAGHQRHNHFLALQSRCDVSGFTSVFTFDLQGGT